MHSKLRTLQQRFTNVILQWRFMKRRYFFRSCEEDRREKFRRVEVTKQDKIPETLGGDQNLTCLVASTLSKQYRSTLVHGFWRTSVRVALTHFQGETPMRNSAMCA